MAKDGGPGLRHRPSVYKAAHTHTDSVEGLRSGTPRSYLYGERIPTDTQKPVSCCHWAGGRCDVTQSCRLHLTCAWLPTLDPPPLPSLRPGPPPPLTSRRLGPRLGARQRAPRQPHSPTQDTRASLVAGFRSLSSSSAFPVNPAAAPQPLPDHHFPLQWQLLPPTPGRQPNS